MPKDFGCVCVCGGGGGGRGGEWEWGGVCPFMVHMKCQKSGHADWHGHSRCVHCGTYELSSDQGMFY